MEDIEKVVRDFGKVQEEVSKRIPTHYPTLKFPKSLLPYKKEVIAEAMKKAIQINPELSDLLGGSLVFLDGFIDDEEAYRENHGLLGETGYWKAIRGKGII